jgi:(p)ppGpp synthase/HD superfamily hydrolase
VLSSHVASEENDTKLVSLEHAIQIAVEAHRGMKDKGGAPYILHPLRIMLQMETDLERTVAVLHDVVEDSEWTLDRLLDEGFSEEVVQALDCLTKQEGEDYAGFIERVQTNSLAVVVKIADLRDNLDVSRLPKPTDEDIARVRKYKKALSKLTG